MTSRSGSKRRSLSQILQDSGGQGLVEYALILVLIAVIVIAALQNVGSSANTGFSTINSAMNP